MLHLFIEAHWPIIFCNILFVFVTFWNFQNFLLSYCCHVLTSLHLFCWRSFLHWWFLTCWHFYFKYFKLLFILFLCMSHIDPKFISCIGFLQILLIMFPSHSLVSLCVSICISWSILMNILFNSLTGILFTSFSLEIFSMKIVISYRVPLIFFSYFFCPLFYKSLGI